MKRNNIFLFVIVAGLLTIITSSCGKSSNTPTPAGSPGTASNIVTIANMSFNPSTITVKLGTTVTWKNTDGFAHTVTSDDGTNFNSGNLGAGASFSYATKNVGTFDYHCNIHSGMSGTLVVTQ